MPLTHERLLMLLRYNATMGVFTWLVNRGGSVRTGDLAGSVHPRGYRFIEIDGVTYAASRLAWFYMTGAWPQNEIDHKDRNPLNNIWDNLREATRAQNNRNQRRRRDNTTGFKGVRFFKGKFQVRMRVDGVKMHLGTFDTAEKAAECHRQAIAAWHGEFAHDGMA